MTQRRKRSSHTSLIRPIHSPSCTRGRSCTPRSVGSLRAEPAYGRRGASSPLRRRQDCGRGTLAYRRSDRAHTAPPTLPASRKGPRRGSIPRARERQLLQSADSADGRDPSIPPLGASQPFPLRERAVSMVGVRGFEPPAPCSQSRCATGLRHTPNSLESLSLFRIRAGLTRAGGHVRRRGASKIQK